MIRMIGLDLDGTLLTGDKRITEQNRIALQKASGKGIHIVPVTGRPLSGIPLQVTELAFIRYAVTSNGAVVTDMLSGRTIRKRCMTVGKAEEVLRTAEGDAVIREFFTEGRGFHDGKTRALLWKKFEGTPVLRYLERSRDQVDDLYKRLREKTDGIENLSIMCRSREERDRLIAKIQKIDGVRIILPVPTDMEITSAEADKGEALIALAEDLGIRREEVRAMGDGHNDLGLMKAAGLSVAMGNASREVMDAADYVTLDNEHDGVAEAIRKYALEA